MARPEGRQGRGVWSAANLVSLLRLPLAVAFVLVPVGWRLPVLACAALSDLLDGWLARRRGPSRFGAVLDPITDKVFMLTAFAMLALSGALPPLEVLGVLLRDIVAPLGFLAGALRGRRITVPARLGGKLVTVGQVLTLVAWLLGSAYLRPLAWATAAMALYALADYGHAAAKAAAPTGERA